MVTIAIPLALSNQIVRSSLCYSLSAFGYPPSHVQSFLSQYRDCLQPLNGGDGRGPLPHIEFSYIRQLQQDNSELRTLLEEHQAALEMIMAKYRQQVWVKIVQCEGYIDCSAWSRRYQSVFSARISPGVDRVAPN